MIVNHLDLDIAVAEGIISRDQAVQLRDLSVRDMAVGDSPIDFSQDTRDEPFRLLRGFRDVFIAIGVVIFAIGLTAIAWKLTGEIGLSFDSWGQSSGSAVLAILFVSAILCAFGWGLAEVITRRQRLPLSSLVISIGFAFWSASLFGSIAVYFSFMAGLNDATMFQTALGWSAVTGAVLGVAFFYWRYRLPFALFLLAGSFVGLSLLIIRDLLGPEWFAAYGQFLVGLWGIVIFATAMWFDLKDRLRVTRFSECAFWLHLFAAPMLVHALLFGGSPGAPDIGYVLGMMAVLSVVALLIDRRALLVSGLSYFSVAISQLVSGSAFFGDQKFALTTLILGGVVLTLGLGWTPIRRAVMAIIPLKGLKARLPPTAA